MAKQVVTTNNAPGAVGPYSQGIIANGFVYTAGQGPLIPGTKDIAEGGIQGQTRQVFENLKGILEAAGSSLDNVVKVNVYLQDMNDFAAMNEVYASYFTDASALPARTTIQAARLPMDIAVEIEAIATVD
ncbi:MAG: RidA family protein [Burkholderiales bacterium]|nr:RidA family protein [Anaerolineae bacterium]